MPHLARIPAVEALREKDKSGKGSQGQVGISDLPSTCSVPGMDTGIISSVDEVVIIVQEPSKV